ncbi:MAG: hypothetical protein ACM3SS_05775 [Rhodospirillaceae bacterium]
MALIDRGRLLADLSPPLDHLLATQLVDEFLSCERRYIQGDWEPAELDGGQFCEVLARILYHQDSGTLNRAKDFDGCLSYVEKDSMPHAMTPRHDALHLAKVLRAIYKFRSQRGAVHISPTYKPNHMDSKWVVESVRWAFNETLRIFWNGDRNLVAKAIRELLQFDVPCVGNYDGILLVQRTDLRPEEEILVLLHYAGEVGLTRSELGSHVRCASQRVSDALKKLEGPDHRQIVKLASGRYRLTDLGSKRIREDLSAKLMVQ